MTNKYVLNMGLAFDEDRVLNKFSKLAKEGWILEEMTLLKYRLVKRSPQDLVYSMDYKALGEDKESYFQLFKDSGWTHMCSYGPFHFFSAAPGTVPIYTDNENYKAKYNSVKGSYFKALLYSGLTLIVAEILDKSIANKIDSRMFHNILLLIGGISVVVAAPSLMVTIAYLIRTKKGLVNK